MNLSIDKKIGERIVKAKETLKIDTATLAAFINESESVIEDVENGILRLEILKLCQIADCLGVSLDWLICGSIKNATDYYVDAKEDENE